MKRVALALCLALTVPAGVVQATEKAHATTEPTLAVAALMRDAERHKGPVVVEGVVSRVYAKEQKLGLIDTAEFKRCGTVTCADMVLPVRWTGSMPEPKALVRIEGEVRKGAAGLEFLARSLEKVSPQPLQTRK
jgi:hypothetical protein